jgi:hypothetical protein
LRSRRPLEGEISSLADTLYKAVDGVGGERPAALRLEHEGALRIPLQFAQHAQLVASDTRRSSAAERSIASSSCHLGEIGLQRLDPRSEARRSGGHSPMTRLTRAVCWMARCPSQSWISRRSAPHVLEANRTQFGRRGRAHARSPR